jgi:hypothetical protein
VIYEIIRFFIKLFFDLLTIKIQWSLRTKIDILVT